MSIIWFLIGFLTANAIGVGALVTIYLRRKRSRADGKIVGYLDLIPDLRPEQRAQVRDIRETFLPITAEIKEKLRGNRSELARLLFAEPEDKPAIYQAVEKSLVFQTRLEHEVVEHILEEKHLLTPDQRKKFHEIIVSQFSGGGLGVHDVEGRRS